MDILKNDLVLYRGNEYKVKFINEEKIGLRNFKMATLNHSVHILKVNVDYLTKIK